MADMNKYPLNKEGVLCDEQGEPVKIRDGVSPDKSKDRETIIGGPDDPVFGPKLDTKEGGQ